MDQFGTNAFPLDGLNSFDAVCGALNQLNVRYALDGLVAYRAGGGTADGPAIMPFMNRNALRFQDEVVLLTNRLIQCQSLLTTGDAASAGGRQAISGVLHNDSCAGLCLIA